MPYTEADIRDKLTKDLQATHCEVVDQSDGCGAKFTALIVSQKFEGLPLLQRHKLVNAALKEEMNSIHAMSMKTLTPGQWQDQQK